MAVERKEDATGNNKYPTTVYGQSDQDAITKKGAKVGGTGNKAEYNCEWVIDFTDLPVTSEFDNQITTLEANSAIKSVDLYILETISGGVNFTVGLSQPDGTVIDADGLVAAETGTAAGTYVSGAGALVGASIGANDAQLTIGGDRTAGKIKVQVNYIKDQV